MEKYAAEKVVGTWDQRECVENGEKDDGMCKKYMMQDGKISKHIDIL